MDMQIAVLPRSHGFGWLRPAVGVIELSQNIIQVHFLHVFELNFLHVTSVNVCRCFSMLNIRTIDIFL
jgi:hypothetical protein